MTRIILALFLAVASPMSWPQGGFLQGFDHGMRRGELRNQLDQARARGDWNAAASLQAELASMGGRPAPVTIQPIPLIPPACTSHQVQVNGRFLDCQTCGQSTQCF